MQDSTIGVFVDIISIHKNTKRAYNAKLDYRAYLERIAKEGRISRAFAYGAQIKDEAKKFISFLKNAGFDVKYCRAKDEITYPENVLRGLEKIFNLPSDDKVFEYLRNKIDINEPVIIPSVQQTDRTMDMVIDILRSIDRLEIVVIGSSNPRIIPIVNYLKEKGIRVIIFSCNIPRHLRNAADVWWEISDRFLEEEKAVEEEVEESSEAARA